MKVYQYNIETGVFTGELCEDPGLIKYTEGITSIAPPFCQHGDVPVFDRQRKVWTVIPLTIARQLLRVQANNSESQS